MIRGMVVRMKEHDKRFKLKKGDVLEAHPYQYDHNKLVVVRRLSDDFDPECTVYRHQVEVLIETRS